jgi:uncharacterized membrane protein HdeD (DUF308 family)
MAIRSGMNWWALALRGVIAILFAILTFVVPGLTLTAIVLLFGAYALIDGVFALISAVRAAHGHGRWGAFLLEGTVGIIAGLITLAAPAVTLAFLIYVVAGWAVITGALELAAAFRLRRHVVGEWLLILAGIVSIVFGGVIFAAPVVGAIAIAWWLGVYALIFGVLLLTLAFRLRALHETTLARVS